jgi:hypothetical protein
VSVLDFIAWGAPDNDWIRNPTDWVGLWRLLSAIPLSLAAIGFGGIGLIGVALERR